MQAFLQLPYHIRIGMCLPLRPCKVNEIKSPKPDISHRVALPSAFDDTCKYTMRAAGLSVHIGGCHPPVGRSLKQPTVDPHEHGSPSVQKEDSTDDICTQRFLGSGRRSNLAKQLNHVLDAVHLDLGQVLHVHSFPHILSHLQNVIRGISRHAAAPPTHHVETQGTATRKPPVQKCHKKRVAHAVPASS